ncbi:MAG TPA: 23S rRNA pseudouridine(1911/1915/1917) synthase RluD [Sedimenticola sp.]|nr:23S rRNA pseudouridine(1911/1915/1917) synthase RluD [Sedimenticola sp.]
MADELTGEVGEGLAGQRLDHALVALFPDFSRSRLQQWIREGCVRVNGALILKPREKVYGGESVVLQVRQAPKVENRPQPIPLNLVHEDASLLVIDKPAGLVVHPAAGNPDGTLQNALLHHDPALARLPRAGIVHRLDKETSGLLVVARTLAAHKSLVAQLQARAMEREYRAIVNGVLTAGGSVDAPIGRHPVHRVRMAVVASGKPAVTHYRVLERFRAHSWLRIRLETGRTHQIRVHMAHIRHPLAGDPVYGGRLRLPAGASPALREALTQFRRQALCAVHLGLRHPTSGEWVAWSVTPPEDLQRLLQALREDLRGD